MDNCVICGKSITDFSDTHTKKYCSHECRMIGKSRRHRELVEQSHEKICENCNAEFISKRCDSRYCSDGCRQAAYRKREKPESANDNSVYIIKNDCRSIEEIIEILKSVNVNYFLDIRFGTNGSRSKGTSKRNIKCKTHESRIRYTHYQFNDLNDTNIDTKIKYIAEIIKGKEPIAIFENNSYDGSNYAEVLTNGLIQLGMFKEAVYI